MLPLSPALGQTDAPPKNARELQQKFAQAYKNKNLGSLDGKNLMNGSVRLIVEHSIAENKNGDALIEGRTFNNFAAIDKWLKRREGEDGTPFRQIMPLLSCGKARCAYNFDGGILHNQLYLHDIWYGFKNGRPYVTKIKLLDGD